MRNLRAMTESGHFDDGIRHGVRRQRHGLPNISGITAGACDPATGRFLTEDPQLFAAGNPAAWVSNDPMNRTDVSGGEEGFAGQVNADPVCYGLSAFGFNTQGSGISNFFQGVGMVAGVLTSKADATADALYQRGAAMAKDAMNSRRGPIEMFQRAVRKVPPALRENFRRTMQASDDLIEESRQFSKTGNRLAKLGLLAGGIQALDNVYQGWSGDPVFDGCNIIRQGLTLGVKTYLARVPGLDLLVDPYFNLIDVGSLNLYQEYFGVDPTYLYTETGWRPPGKRPRPGGKSDNLQSHDPNLIVGPSGVVVGNQRFVARTAELPYSILFENAATASLPANRVSISHTLDPNLDLTTFALGAVSFGGAPGTLHRRCDRGRRSSTRPTGRGSSSS